jgi:hypothetical protein
MKFYSTKAEINTTKNNVAWQTHGDLAYSAASIHYLGVDTKGWTKLQVNPKSDNDLAEMTFVLQAVCTDLANPDEDSNTLPKSYILEEANNKKNVILHLEDVNDFLERLSLINCITQDDFTRISSAIEKPQGSRINTNFQNKSSSFVDDHDVSTFSCSRLVF